MTYSQKITAALNIIVQFNRESPQKIDEDAFLQDLKALGGTSDAALKICRWEDLEKCGNRKDENNIITGGIPVLVARQIADVFRKSAKSDRPQVFTEKKALRLTPEELLKVYDPRDPESPVAKRLKQLSKGLPCIVFEAQTHKVHVKASLSCLDDILDDQEPLPHYILNGIPHKIYKVGGRPNKTVAENPLFPGHALRGSEDVCHKTTRSWKDIPHRARVLLRLALSTRELKIAQVGDVHDTLDLVNRLDETDEGSVVKLFSTRFPQAALKYSELEATGNLPTLRLIRNGNKSKQDPFFGSSHKTF
jgi:hypothetical protein